MELAGLRSIFEYDAIDPDVGTPGIKVRPNRVHNHERVSQEQTFAQIGHALAKCADFARDLGVEIRLEVHGSVTYEPANIRTIVNYTDSRNLFVYWNSTPQDVENGALDRNFKLLSTEIRLVYINEPGTTIPGDVSLNCYLNPDIPISA